MNSFIKYHIFEDMSKQMPNSFSTFRFLGLLLIALIFSGYANSQELVKLNPNKSLTQYTLRNWDAEKGMASDASVNIIQSEKGYIWVATYKGIARFDGANFTVYDLNKNAELGNTSVQIQGLVQGTDNVIWFATLQGLVAYKNNKFFREEKLKDLEHEIIESLHYQKETSTLWIGTNSKGIYSFDGQTLTAYSNFLNLTKAVVNIIQSDLEGNIWIGTEGGDIIIYKNQKFEKISNNIRFGSIGGFYFSKSTRWIGTGEGVYIYKDGSLEKFEELKLNKITDLIEDTNGILWLGSQSGLYRYNLSSKQLDSYNEANGFPSNLIRNLMVDKEGSLWIATYRKGLAQLSDGLVLNYSTDEGLSTNVITGIAQYDENKYFIGDEAGTINILKNNTISALNTRIPIPKDRLKHILVDSNKNLWVSTYGGLLKIMPNGEEKLFNSKSGFPSESTRMVFEDKTGNIWVGTRSEGLFRLSKNGEVIQVYNQDNGLSSNYIMGIEQDKLGRIIITTKNGLNIISSNNIVGQINNKDGMPGNFAFNAYADTDNVLWVSSNDGLIRIENDTSIFVFNILNGLFDNSLYDVLEDDYGFFWMPTNFGIARVSKNELNAFAKGNEKSYTYRLFGRSDGMKSLNCIGATKSLKATDGRMFFPTSGGVAIVIPKDLQEIESSTDVIFEHVIADDVVFFPTENGIDIPAGHRRFQIHFTSLNLRFPERMQFRFMLEPFDKDWVVSGSERTARYTNITPGEYIFKVNISSGEGLWSNQTFSIPIIIEPSWHQTTLFKILVTLVLSIFIWLLFKLRTRSIRIQKVELERQVIERTALIAQQKFELEQQASELQKLSIVASHTNNAVLIADPSGNIIWVNDAFSMLYGYSLDEYIAQKGNSILKVSGNPDIAYVIEECITTKSPTTYSVQVETKSGSKTWIQTTLTPILNSNGTLQNLVAIDSDITALKDAEAEMISMSDEIINQSEAIMQQNEEIKSQRDELEQINNLLISHTENIEASIRYAKTIQQAILPEKSSLDGFFENFIVYKPRDIVSGDFYWFSKVVDFETQQEKYLLAVVDCTGHGVPGAFMSVIGSRLITEIVTEHKILTPSNILVQLNRMVNQVLRQDKSESFDGMDVALCLFDFNSSDGVKLTFSGANRPLMYLRKGETEFQTLRGSRKTIGGIMPDIDAEFANHDFIFNPGDIIVLNTDGFIDQNGDGKTKFSYVRLQQFILENANQPMQLIGEQLDTAFEEFRGLQNQRDDATVIGIRFKER